ncbi:hypothetical protein BC777_1151 [Yoonia maricola]|uniref:Probable membrane transporter protein n=1 Tax=Yoonia maricola TaxID=420999 RepID=A0A2M8WN64_9RHOB|nr:sulfite exporter TauE/SafE family protein [Yoonia maricola]PJI92306.1 hypothetical protein BC777_1151 [Yoonia maricola]
MTFESYLVAAFAVIITGISKSGFAGGLGILGVPLVALTMPPQAAAVLLLPVLIGIDMLSVWRYRAALKPRMIGFLLPGASIGIALGMFSFSRVNPDYLRIAIGIMAIGFVARFVWSKGAAAQIHVRQNRGGVLIASVLSGFAGFVAHAGGPPIKGTLLGMNLDKTAFVGTNAFFFFLLNLAKGGGYAALGLFSTHGLLASASLVPFLVIGVWLGFSLHKRVPQQAFMRLAYGLLAVAGCNLLVLGVVSVSGAAVD